MTCHAASGGTLDRVLMVIGGLVVLLGVVVGWFTIAGSGIHNRPYSRQDAPGSDRMHGESPLDSPWKMAEWSRGTQGRRRRT
jgi:hypothetical protein